MNILLTNDDGWDSPLLPFTADYLREMGDLTIALPQEEQSWTGKAMTRFGRLQVEERELCGITGYSISGRPADCMNLALHHLCPKLPDLIVSGINMGSNLGVSFIVSSGTVGACLEANIAGIPGIALSQCLQPETYKQWANEQHLPAAAVVHPPRFPPKGRFTSKWGRLPVTMTNPAVSSSDLYCPMKSCCGGRWTTPLSAFTVRSLTKMFLICAAGG